MTRTLVPAFYRYLQAQDPAAQTMFGSEFTAALEGLVGLFERAEREIGGEGEKGLGLWVEGGELGMTDVMVGPCSFINLFYHRW